MGIIFGSARIDERGNIVGGAAGDQTGGEVSTQPYYMHSSGWYALRPKSTTHAAAIASAMSKACVNANIGYDQNQRNTVITMLRKYGSLGAIAEKCEADCSSLVRACIIQATGRDVGDIYTGNLASALEGSGLFEKRFSVSSEGQLYNGDVLVTKVKGHTVIVVSGRPRPGNSAPQSSGAWKATGTATSTENGVNVRQSPAGTVIGQVHKGNRFEVDGQKSGEWVHVKVANIGVGYIHKDYVKYDNPAPAPSAKPKIDSAKSYKESLAGTYKVVNTGAEGLNLRAGANTSKAALAVMPEGAICKNYGYYTSVDGVKWLYVQYGGQTGFAASSYLTKTK